MKRFFSLLLLLTLLSAGALAAGGYHQNSDGVYVDDAGQVIEELWDDDAGIVIFNGSLQKQVNVDENPTDAVQNSDGSITVESGQYQVPESTTETTHKMTDAEWGATWAKYAAANGTTTGTVYLNEQGEMIPAEILALGLGRSTIRAEGETLLVPTSSLRWDTEAPEDKVLAVSTPSSQTYLTIRAKTSKKAFVMGHCDKCTVVRVIRTGKTWTMVDAAGVRGYVLTSGLTFYPNVPQTYAAGIITVKGKTPSGNTVHVRSANKNSARQIAEYPVGTPITVFSQEGKWSEIDVEGLHCYILSEFVTLQEPLPVPEEEPAA